jgi:hypothetical protein
MSRFFGAVLENWVGAGAPAGQKVYQATPVALFAHENCAGNTRAICWSELFGRLEEILQRENAIRAFNAGRIRLACAPQISIRKQEATGSQH